MFKAIKESSDREKCEYYGNAMIRLYDHITLYSEQQLFRAKDCSLHTYYFTVKGSTTTAQRLYAAFSWKFAHCFFRWFFWCAMQ